jgi:molecular chaperone Hsp33
MIKDFLYTGRLERFRIGVSYGVCTHLVNEAVVRHDCDPLAAHILGRALTAGVLAASLMKSGERVNLHWSYQGALRSVVVDAGADGSTRGFISPKHLSLVAENPDELFGDHAQLRVIRTADGAVQSSGTVQSILQDVVNDLTFFFAISDQIETGMMVMIGFEDNPDRPVGLCQGLMLQALPDCNLEEFDRIRGQLDNEKVRSLLSRSSESDNYLEDILNVLLTSEVADPQLHLEGRPAPFFSCECNREKIGTVVRALGYQERVDVVKKNEDLAIHCEFCNEAYTMTVDDCIKAWNEHPLSNSEAES